MSQAIHPALRLLILALAAFLMSLVFIHLRHWINHSVTEIEADHDHLFVTNLVARVSFILIFAIIVRWVAHIQTLDGWVFCAIGVATVLYPALLAGVILMGSKPHMLSASTGMEIPYLMLIFTYLANLIVAAIYGVLGWACMCLPAAPEETTQGQA